MPLVAADGGSITLYKHIEERLGTSVDRPGEVIHVRIIGLLGDFALLLLI